MERTIDVSTGESVAFSYELAGLGSRFLAVFIDTAIQFAVLAGALAIFALFGAGADALVHGRAFGLARSVVVALAIAALFALFFGYFIAFETFWNGRTPGKALLGIRVVRDGGFPPDLASAAIRNVVRVLEAGLGFYAISAVCALLSPANRRLGDMAAGTIVVRDDAFESAPPAPVAERDDPVARALSPRERGLVRAYAARRPSLVPRARASVAAEIASVVRPKLAASYEHLDDDALLTFLAENAL
ncbi:MAG: RDD family protein [Candidatus Baltobacteraceae bacterium]